MRGYVQRSYIKRMRSAASSRRPPSTTAHVLQFAGGADSDTECVPVEGAPVCSGDEQFHAPRPSPRPASP
eukprot:6928139-Alexandrium_andersonii.AAC.1